MMQLYNFKMSVHFSSMKVCLNKSYITCAFTYNSVVKKYGRVDDHTDFKQTYSQTVGAKLLPTSSAVRTHYCLWTGFLLKP